MDDSLKGVPPDVVDRKGLWNLSVTRNRRLTFRIDNAEQEIYNVNLEDYH